MQWQPRLLGPMGGSVVGVQIAGDDFRLETVEAAQIFNRFLEGFSSFESLEIADVLAEEDILAHCDGHRVLEMAADREHRWQALGTRMPSGA